MNGQLHGSAAVACSVWFGNRRFNTQEYRSPALCDPVLGSAPNNLVLAKSSLRLCASASLRLCVEIDAGKTQSRKDAKPQGINRTRARRRTSSAQALGTNQREPRSGTETAIPRCLKPMVELSRSAAERELRFDNPVLEVNSRLHAAWHHPVLQISIGASIKVVAKARRM